MAQVLDQYNVSLAIVRLVEDGKTFTEACREVGQRPSTVKKWIERSEELQAVMYDALQTNYDALADKLINIDQHFEDDSKMAATVSKNIQWVLARRDQQRFGDRMMTEHKITADKVIIEALAMAKTAFESRNLPSPQILTLPSEDFVEIIQEEDDWMTGLV